MGPISSSHQVIDFYVMWRTSMIYRKLSLYKYHIFKEDGERRTFFEISNREYHTHIASNTPDPHPTH